MTPSRKYIDLILSACGKWANWDPAIPIAAVGDFGTIDKKTGRFEKKGNILNDERFRNITKGSSVVKPKGTEDPMLVTSKNARKAELIADASFDAQVTKVLFRGSWSFQDETGAVLILHRPFQTSLSPDIDIDALVGHELLRGMCIVRDLITCQAYAKYLSSSGGGSLSLSLGVTGALPAGGGGKATWGKSSVSGVFVAGQPGEDEGEAYPFTPLFTLKKCKKKSFFGHRGPLEGSVDPLDSLEAVDTPWNPLDEEGEEKLPRAIPSVQRASN